METSRPVPVTTRFDTPAPGDDWSGLGDFVKLATERIVDPVEGMHTAIVDRWLSPFGPRASLIRSLTSAATSSVYRAVRSAGSLLGAAVTAQSRTALPRTDIDRPRSARLVRTIRVTTNGVWGDELERRTSNFEIGMELRTSEGDPIRIDSCHLRRTIPHATDRLVFLIHGWSEDERCWYRQPDESGAPGLAHSLGSDDRTTVLVRYNSGRHVSTNGALLSTLIEALVRAWPVDVDQVDLVGHSMGGLVARSAIHAGRIAGHRWTGHIEHLVTIGTPHLGSPIEKGVAIASSLLRFAPETRPLSEFLESRSSGVKDLRFGSVTEEHHLYDTPYRVVDKLGHELEPDQGVNRHFATGAITRDPTHPVGMMIGDLVVRQSSGTGRGGRRVVGAMNTHVVGGRTHLGLLYDERVHEQVADWLAIA